LFGQILLARVLASPCLGFDSRALLGQIVLASHLALVSREVPPLPLVFAAALTIELPVAPTAPPGEAIVILYDHRLARRSGRRLLGGRCRGAGPTADGAARVGEGELALDRRAFGLGVLGLGPARPPLAEVVAHLPLPIGDGAIHGLVFAYRHH